MPEIISAVQPNRTSRSAIWAFIVLSGCLSLFAGIMPLVQLPGAQAVPFFVVFTGIWAGASCAALTRAVVRLELTAAELRWRAPLRGGVIPLDQITAIRRETLGRPRNQNYSLTWSIRIEARNRRPLRFVGNPGMAAFTDEIKAAALISRSSSRPPSSFFAVCGARA